MDRKGAFDTAGEYLKELFKGGADIFKKSSGIPIPTNIFDLLFKSRDKGEDVFKYLEEFYASLVYEKNLKPVFVLDELPIADYIRNRSS